MPTTGVGPLRSLRDETPTGRRAATIGLAEVADALAAEEPFGYRQRPRRVRAQKGRKGMSVVLNGSLEGGGEDKGKETEERWDPLAHAQEKIGRYFVVRTKSGASGGEGMG